MYILGWGRFCRTVRGWVKGLDLDFIGLGIVWVR